MEANELLHEILALAQKITKEAGNGRIKDGRDLARLVLELDSSLAGGGIYPSRWIVVVE